MEDPIIISWLNDFVFCPASIYFHQLYGCQEKMLYQCTDQVNGTNAHAAIDNGNYSTKKNVLQAIPVYCEKYGLVGKIDLFDVDTGVLTERKNKITKIYDGYVYQLYAQYFALLEMGYEVNKIRFYAINSNKSYFIDLPTCNKEMLIKFENAIKELHNFKLEVFKQTNVEKCKHCIYEAACDRSLL